MTTMVTMATRCCQKTRAAGVVPPTSARPSRRRSGKRRRRRVGHCWLRSLLLPVAESTKRPAQTTMRTTRRMREAAARTAVPTRRPLRRSRHRRRRQRQRAVWWRPQRARFDSDSNHNRNRNRNRALRDVGVVEQTLGMCVSVCMEGYFYFLMIHSHTGMAILFSVSAWPVFHLLCPSGSPSTPITTPAPHRQARGSPGTPRARCPWRDDGPGPRRSRCRGRGRRAGGCSRGRRPRPRGWWYSW